MTQPKTIHRQNAWVSIGTNLAKTSARAVLAAWHTAEAAYEQMNSRRAIEHMLEFDDAILRDMGVSRADIRRAVNMPLHKSAGEELARASRNTRDL